MCWSNKILQIHRVSHDNHQNYGSTNNFPQSPGCPCFHKWWRSLLPHGSDYLLPASARKRSQQKHTTIICCDFEQLLQTSDLKFITVKGFRGHQGIPSISSQPKIHRVLSSGESIPWGANAKTWCFCVLLGWLAMGINDEKNNKFCFRKSKICSKRKNKEVGNDASLIVDVTPQSKDWWKPNCLLPNAHTWWGLWGFHAGIIPNLHPPTTRYKMASHSWTLQSLAFSLRTWIQVQKFKKSHYPIPPNSMSLHSFYTFPRSPNLHKAFRLGVEEGGTTQNADSQSDVAKQKNGSKMLILKQFGVTRKLKWQNNIAHQILSSSLFSGRKRCLKNTQ